MWTILFAWRGEILTLLAWVLSWLLFKFVVKTNFWHLLAPGVLLGTAVEFMTEPEWTYAMKVYVWRDISPFVILGWGIVFSWLITISDYAYDRLFRKTARQRDPVDPRLFLTDLLIGVPLFLGNELFGLHILKVWKYNPVLQWDTIIPVIDYPLEGLIAIVFFTLAVPAAVRYWKG